MQSKLDQQAINKVKGLQELIKSLPEFEANQVKYLALQMINNSPKTLDDMTEKERVEMFRNMVEVFKFKELI